MFDVALTHEILSQIYGATQTVLRRFQRIKSPLDFTGSDEGMERLDAICIVSHHYFDIARFKAADQACE